MPSDQAAAASGSSGGAAAAGAHHGARTPVGRDLEGCCLSRDAGRHRWSCRQQGRETSGGARASAAMERALQVGSNGLRLDALTGRPDRPCRPPAQQAAALHACCAVLPGRGHSQGHPLVLRRPHKAAQPLQPITLPASRSHLKLARRAGDHGPVGGGGSAQERLGSGSHGGSHGRGRPGGGERCGRRGALVLQERQLHAAVGGEVPPNAHQGHCGQRRGRVAVTGALDAVSARVEGLRALPPGRLVAVC